MADVVLFAGAGGLAQGLQEAGFGPLHLYEADPYCCDTLRESISSNRATLTGKVVECDVRSFDWATMSEPTRLMAAAPPCQPFSLAGKHRADNDERNLFPELARAISALQPEVVLVENVRGLVRESFKPYFDYILSQLEAPSLERHERESWQSHDKRLRKYRRSTDFKPEYNVRWRLLEAADFGVPQLRQRVFIVTTKCGLPAYEFPEATHSRQVLETQKASGSYWRRHGVSPRRGSVNGNGTSPSAKNKLPWVTVRDALKSLPRPAGTERSSEMNHWVVRGARSYHGHSGSDFDLPSKTMKAGVHGVPGGENVLRNRNGKIRYFTLREAARLQTFPDEHFFRGARTHVTRQIGNAVPCRLVQAVASPLFDVLNATE